MGDSLSYLDNLLSQFSRENATPSSGTSPVASHYPPRGALRNQERGVSFLLDTNMTIGQQTTFAGPKSNQILVILLNPTGMNATSINILTNNQTILTQ